MAQVTQCSKCRQGRPCLSHTQIPFDGTCWLDQQELAELIRATKRDPRIRQQSGRMTREAGTGRYLIALKGLWFDVIPLRYLDWLSGQAWVYGDFRKRLTAYLTRPCIERELERLFPDDPTDNQPCFQVACSHGGWHYPEKQECESGHQDAPWFQDTSGTLCPTQCFGWDRWHGQPMPEQPEDTDPSCKPWTPPSTWTQKANAWRIAADAMVVFTEGEGQYEDLNKLDIDGLKEAAKHLPGPTVSRLRRACTEWHNRLREAVHEDAEIIILAGYLAEALDGPLFQTNEPKIAGKRVVRNCNFATCSTPRKNLRTTNTRKPVYGRRLACSA